MHDTRERNRDRSDISHLDEIWLFGYGSLIYKVDFPFISSAPCFIHGWERRLWQGSHDHRGTPEKPGRVLTLIEEPQAKCFGIAYRVTEREFDHLDHREKNGYLRCAENLHFLTGEIKPGVMYIAKPDNSAFLGPASDTVLAEQIFNSRGPSGTNQEYVAKLAESLKQYNQVDEHIMSIDALLREMNSLK